MLTIGEEEHVLIESIAALHPAEHRNDAGAVAVADVVLAARCLVAATLAAVYGGQHQVRRVDVGAVGLFRQAERCDRSAIE
ncbi:Uncharacterised protein [Mycobacteroides abscessus subsp. abscessus]|nr:Uncharacterised protein [Mycobacteroides abscessus subsp. abscessus]